MRHTKLYHPAAGGKPPLPTRAAGARAALPYRRHSSKRCFAAPCCAARAKPAAASRRHLSSSSSSPNFLPGALPARALLLYGASGADSARMVLISMAQLMLLPRDMPYISLPHPVLCWRAQNKHVPAAFFLSIRAARLLLPCAMLAGCRRAFLLLNKNSEKSNNDTSSGAPPSP